MNRLLRVVPAWATRVIITATVLLAALAPLCGQGPGIRTCIPDRAPALAESPAAQAPAVSSAGFTMDRAVPSGDRAVVPADRPAGPARDALSRADQGETWAVVVGVSRYQYLEDLSYADDDADAFYDTFSGIWGESHVKLLVDSQATKSAIRNAISTWLDPLEDPGDTVIFCFSGHGSSQTDASPIDESDSWDESICPYDSSALTVTNRISDDELTDWLDGLDSGRQVVMLDSCLSGGFTAGSRGPAGAPCQSRPRGQASATEYSEGLARDLSRAGRVVLAASAEDESSYETPFLEHGVFSYYVLEAFAELEAVDANYDSLVSAEEVFGYAGPRTTGEEAEQHPEMSDGYSGELALFGTATITVDVAPRISAVTLDGVSHAAAGLPLSATVITGTSHTLSVSDAVDTGTAERRYAFTSWSDGSSESSRTVSASGAASYTAAYETQCHLAIQSERGNPQGSGWYAQGSEARFSVDQVAGESGGTRYVFAGWGGGASGASNPASIVMDSPRTVTTSWQSQYQLTVTSRPANAAVLSGDGWYSRGAAVSTAEAVRTADAGAGSRYVISSWTVDGNRSSASPAPVSMTAPHAVTVDCTLQHQLTVVSERGNPQGSGWYDADSAARISVSSPQGAIIRQVFAGWDGGSSATGAEATVIMDGPKTVTARWRTDYTQLYALMGGMLVLGAVAAGGVFWMVKRSRSLP